MTKLKDLENIKKVRFIDETDYEPGFSNNGGRYRYSENYQKTESGDWERYFGCSSSMDFCPCCGSFDDHYMDDVRFTCGKIETISDAELLEKINSFDETDELYIELIYN